MKEDDQSRGIAQGSKPRERAKTAVAYPKITPRSLTDSVINALKDALLEGRLRPGEAIVERDVAMQMKVGTPVVREALIALQGQGFVRRVPNTGTYVTEFDADDIVNFIGFGLNWKRWPWNGQGSE